MKCLRKDDEVHLCTKIDDNCKIQVGFEPATIAFNEQIHLESVALAFIERETEANSVIQHIFDMQIADLRFNFSS